MGTADRRLDARPIRLGIVDDHPLIAAAVEAAIASEPRGPDDEPIEVVAVARSAEGGRQLLLRTDPERPDVVLVDLHLDGDARVGLDLLAHAPRDGARVVVLTSFERASFMRAAFERGAVGFLPKSADGAGILRAVRAVAHGGTAFSAEAIDAARSGPRPPSDREVAILRLIQAGATSEEVGVRLGISDRTVESHLRRLFDRYGVVSRTELVVLAMREGWLPDDG